MLCMLLPWETVFNMIPESVLKRESMEARGQCENGG